MKSRPEQKIHCSGGELIEINKNDFEHQYLAKDYFLRPELLNEMHQLFYCFCASIHPWSQTVTTNSLI